MDAGLSLQFPRAMRLKRRREFDLAKRTGQRLVRGCLVANWLAGAKGTTSRLGVITSRKMGNAVERSRARRLLREVFRLHQHDFQEVVTLVLVARSSIVGRRLAEVERDFLAAMRASKLFKATS